MITPLDPGLDTPASEPLAVEYAGLLTRTIGMVIDAVLINVIATLVSGAVIVVRSLFTIAAPRDGTVLAVIGSCLYVTLVLVYFVGFWVSTGQTVGQRFMQTRVVAIDGGQLLPRRALLRLLGMVISIPLLWGFVPILLSSRRRAVCDWMARTVVIVVGPEAQLSGPSPQESVPRSQYVPRGSR